MQKRGNSGVREKAGGSKKQRLEQKQQRVRAHQEKNTEKTGEYKDWLEVFSKSALNEKIQIVAEDTVRMQDCYAIDLFSLKGEEFLALKDETKDALLKRLEVIRKPSYQKLYSRIRELFYQQNRKKTPTSIGLG